MDEETCPVCLAPLQGDEVSCPRCGFKLSGTTEGFKPYPVDRSAIVDALPNTHEATLQVVRGPRAGIIFKMAGDEITIGRMPQCTIFLNDMTVSRLHATLRREGGAYIIHDENSFNGVWVNNRNVESRALRSGDFIQIGSFSLLYEEE